jgi:hypothetical protein
MGKVKEQLWAPLNELNALMGADEDPFDFTSDGFYLL